MDKGVKDNHFPLQTVFFVVVSLPAIQAPFIVFEIEMKNILPDCC